MNQPEFHIHDCILRISSSDALTFEDAFDELSPIANRFIPEICQALQEAKDSYTRGKFIELLGYTHSDSVIPVLINELNTAEQSVRQWIALAFEEINSPTSLAQLDEYKSKFPADFA